MSGRAVEDEADFEHLYGKWKRAYEAERDHVGGGIPAEITERVLVLANSVVHTRAVTVDAILRKIEVIHDLAYHNGGFDDFKPFMLASIRDDLRVLAALTKQMQSVG